MVEMNQQKREENSTKQKDGMMQQKQSSANIMPSSSSSSSSSTTTTLPATTLSSISIPIQTKLDIVSASYGPAEGRRLYDGTIVDYSSQERWNETYAPYSRDVLPFLRALLVTEDAVVVISSSSLQQPIENKDFTCCNNWKKDDDDNDAKEKKKLLVGSPSINDTTAKSSIRITNSTSSTIGRTNNYYYTSPIVLMDGQSMNAVFGDPCPGTTKVLHVEYVFRDYYHALLHPENIIISSRSEEDDNSNPHSLHHPLHHHHHHHHHFSSHGTTTSRLFTTTFREHERVVLKRQDPLLFAEKKYPGSPQEPQLKKERVDIDDDDDDDDANRITKLSSSEHEQGNGRGGGGVVQTSLSSKYSIWKSLFASSTISEITLPIILPFLTVRQRALCQLVCRSWKEIVLEKGIAVVIDINDSSLFPKSSNTNDNSTSISLSSSSSFSSNDQDISSALVLLLDTTTASTRNNNLPCSRSILRGLLKHSHSSLEALVLNDFISLQPELDLHPALPFLRKVQRLDISRIPTITDVTLDLISKYIGPRLEVLYMKGLRHVTNDGIVHLVQTCSHLRVLDVSQVYQLDDVAGMAIGRYLTQLEVLHGKDNYRLTNRSIDWILGNCRHLVQVTLWGCIRLTGISFHTAITSDQATIDPEGLDVGTTSSSSSGHHPSLSALYNTTPLSPPMKLIVLNLWGCHALTDDVAHHIGHLHPSLRSLCVSECHRLTDQFVIRISQSLTRLLHLQLRYVRRITDVSLTSISSCMTWLYSLDVSYCTKLTINGITHLLMERCNSLSELRLYSCRNLHIESINYYERSPPSDTQPNGQQLLLRTLQSVRGESILSFLDLRECQQEESFSRDATWFQAMVELGYKEYSRGLFRRPALCSEEVRTRLAPSKK